MLAYECDELPTVPGLADHLEPGVLEQARKALPEENIVVGNDDAGDPRIGLVPEAPFGTRHRRKYP